MLSFFSEPVEEKLAGLFFVRRITMIFHKCSQKIQSFERSKHAAHILLIANHKGYIVLSNDPCLSRPRTESED
jgi:hypothetical protein